MMTEEEIRRQKLAASAMRKMTPIPDMRIEDAPLEFEQNMMTIGDIGQPGMTRDEAFDYKWKMREDEYDRILELSKIPANKRTREEEIERLYLGKSREERLQYEVDRTTQNHERLLAKKRKS
jgi:hypothetical protein